MLTLLNIISVSPMIDPCEKTVLVVLLITSPLRRKNISSGLVFYFKITVSFMNFKGINLSK